MLSAVETEPDALVLELDPDLGRGISEAELEAAREACRGELVRVPRGRWSLPVVGDEDLDSLGFVIVEGMVSREMRLDSHYMFELLGQGDLLHAPVHPPHSRLGGRVEFTAVSDAVLVELGEPFLRASARWPALMVAVHNRLEAHREALAVQGLIAHFPGADARLLLMFWQLSERWGIVTREGIVLPLPLTHELLGRLIRARRSTTTLALGTLVADGSVCRRDDGAWLLTTLAERKVEAITRSTNSKPTLGEQLMLSRMTSETTEESRAVRAQTRQSRAQRPARRTWLADR